MKHLTRTWVVWLLLAAVAGPASAQNVTTGSLSGVVSDAQGGVLPGATVVAVHTPTGSTYETVAQGDGRFQLINVRVGGPYTITIAMPSFQTATINDVNVALGETSTVPVTMQLEALAERVEVVAEASQVFSATRTGTTASVGTAVLERLPTVNRSLQDFARTNPFVSQTATNQNPGALSIAGRSGRYNNLQIDGAVNNDIFGLADSATPGGQASTEPVSLDAIQELQLVVSPYDVRQGSFSGGGINAITRSGSNAFHGTGYYFFRDEGFVGNGIDDRPIATFDDKQGGGSLGGPIKANRAFFFGNFDFGRKNTPSGVSVDGSSGQAFGREAEVQQVINILQTRYGYDPGDFSEEIRATTNNKFFVRGDVNLGKHQLVIRNNYIDAANDIGNPSLTTYILQDNFYTFNSDTNSTVGQLNSAFGTYFNEARVSYQRIRDARETPSIFPPGIVRFTGNQAVRFGTEVSSGANELDQDMIEIHNDLTMVRGNHQFTFGTHNEFFHFRNLFIQNIYGSYDFPSLAAFDQGLAGNYQLGFSRTSDPLQSADFWVYQLGFYAGDQWRIAPRLSMTYGLRLDIPGFPKTPAANPQVEQIFGQRTDVVPSTRTWSPRAGINYDLSTDTTRQQLRAGIGLFGGRTPYVWLSNQYTGTGNEFTRLNATGQIPFVADPNNQPRSVGNAATNEVNLVDPAYDFPQLIRGNVGFDRELGFQGVIASVETLFSTTVKDIDYRNFNLNQTGTRPDGRPFFTRLNAAYTDAIFLTNTSEGDAWSIAMKLERPFRGNWFASASYLYGQSNTVSDGTNSTARSNWLNAYNQGDPNAIPVATSNFNPGHRVNLSGSYRLDFDRARVTFSAFYNGQTGRPYAYTYGNDANGDGLGVNNSNDLLYIPRDASDVIVANGTFDQLMAFINAGNCSDLTPGTIMERNTCRAPWTNTLDFRAAVDVPVGKLDTELTIDVLNFINVFDSGAGQVEFALFNSLQPVNQSVDAATGKYIYTLNTVTQPGQARYQRDDLRSRWQAQIGLRVRF